MNKLKAETLFESLSKVDDPRREHQKFHSLFDILVISICAVLCGADHWTEMEEFGEAKQEWFSTFLELKNGIPSHDTFRRVFILLDNIELKEVFVEWIGAAISLGTGALVNIDGREFVWKQSCEQRKKGVECGQRVGIGSIRRLGTSQV